MNKFQNNTLNFTQEELNKEDPKNAKNAVFMQAAKTLSFIGVLKEENKEYFWTTKFLNKFQKFDQSFLENKEQFIQEIYDFGSEELINKIDAYVEFLKQNYENSNDEEESDFRENLQKRILLADSNWIHSILIDFDVEGETLSEDNNWILEYKKFEIYLVFKKCKKKIIEKHLLKYFKQ
ncbi:Uncharacterised protein (plasmid) [Mycoplasmopsis gallopavonis]|uniref:Uncharacterized protein n=1 Tax=Mycoplasmopsis gallopavonis TaxID=76629 RepID=A0A449B0N0_9BACT|nr:hypothetical protein [Mycoplasmopsis gallopavonis]VEU73341.1 Uncharacterised protein [Mycoplasmopsis gallopavonis]